MTCVLYFDVSDETMKTRLMKRGETSGRADDNEETILKRLKTFHDLTQPVIDYYDAQAKVNRVSVVSELILDQYQYMNPSVSRYVSMSPLW